ncbi:hypothetical protein KUH32_04665 [Thalassococcus sp. CAU 1522]|uniref:Thiol:disulfide interchange protein DsbD N-terminal domain-containing protein n=1 Tax=Thalassococcus arenae TaxID=2851652 RepID=A0ABS6N4W9_9RHOB|nr:protein-disulfide reductase DsbD domain-containing protein [Thalassococcus arenae]MBV2359059.1 hypothetical protein [Thalassococcus arenae]
MIRSLLLACAAIVAAPLGAQSFDGVVEAQLRPGWRLADGSHMAALQLNLAPGWKTYWRAPGDAGIPPLFDWRGGAAVSVLWPAPEVFHQSGMRSVGYDDTVVLPLRVVPQRAGDSVALSGTIDIGICEEVCIPYRVSVAAELPAGATKPDSVIVAALADLPYSADEAGVRAVTCSVALDAQGLRLRTEIAMPKQPGAETVIETADPEIWVAEPRSWWEGGRLISETRLTHMAGGALALDRSRLTITVLGRDRAVEIRGCD